MKQCTKCELPKPLDEFSFKNKSKGIRTSYCQQCNKEYQKEHYRGNKGQYKKKAKEWDRKNIQQNRHNLLRYYAEHPCVDCGETEPVFLDFDHISGKKSYHVSQMMLRFVWSTILLEIEKCVVRCVRCHRLKTARENNWWSLERDIS